MREKLSARVASGGAAAKALFGGKVAHHVTSVILLLPTLLSSDRPIMAPLPSDVMRGSSTTQDIDSSEYIRHQRDVIIQDKMLR